MITHKKAPEYYKGLLIKADKNLHAHIFQEVKKISKNKNLKILDFGCGEGALSQKLADAGHEVFSVDKDKHTFKASTHFIHLDFSNKSEVRNFIEKYKERFDIVLGIEVIEHVKEHWEYIKTLKELTKPKGFIFISTPNVTSWLSRFYFLIYGRFHQFMNSDIVYGHINPISLWQIEYIFQELDIKICQKKPAGSLPALYFPNLSLKSLIVNLFSFLLRPLMKEDGGFKTGWCVLVIGKKND